MPKVHVTGQDAASVRSAEGKHFLEQGRALDAVTAYRKHLRLKGADPQSLNGLAIAYSELGRSDLATEMFSRALAMAPDDPATLNNIGFAALRRADARLARYYLERARERSGEPDEIEGNLKRLALLEAFKRDRFSNQAQMRASLSWKDEPSMPFRLFALLKDGSPEEPTKPKSKSERLNTTPATMIDFMAVLDPFIQSHQVVQIQ